MATFYRHNQKSTTITEHDSLDLWQHWRVNVAQLMRNVSQGLICHFLSDQVPVILVGKDYWSGMLSWIKKTMLETHHFIEPFELEILRVVDRADEAFAIIEQTKERTL